MSRRVWIIGPVAVDRVAYIDELPQQGTFVRPLRITERIGGSSGNVALALSEAGVETGFISYVGNDKNGATIKERFTASKIQHLSLQEIVGDSNSALVMVDSDGERTIVALTESHLAEISIADVDFRSDDIVVFSLWRPFFASHLRHIQDIGCTTVVGLEALADPAVHRADFAIGSEAELGSTQISNYLDRFSTIVVTRGAAGVDQYQGTEQIHVDALNGPVVDTTGAGDSFLAGYLSRLAQGDCNLRSALDYGIRWSAATVAIEGSEPAQPPL
ncbi:MAG: carbohydrate kinase family protein [Candidatus Planktophila sp.]